MMYLTTENLLQQLTDPKNIYDGIFMRKLLLYFRKEKQSQSGHANKKDITTTSTLLQ